MSTPHPPPCKLLPWDSEFFGCRIARVCSDALRAEEAKQIDDWSRQNRARCLYFLSRADDPTTIQIAEHHGFGLVDIRVTFECILGDAPGAANSDPPGGVRIRPAQPGDLVPLQAVARAAHHGTRFFNDPHFSRQRAEDLYSRWITLEIQGGAQVVLVAEPAAGGAMGYVTCHLKPVGHEGLISLVGVRAEFRGTGIGRSLVVAAVNWFRGQGARKVTVVTQGNNETAQRLYQRCGFLTRDLQLWYHKWYPMLD